jgi:hypothetical protein
MAQENIEITHPNFCLGPQTGTFGTINTSDVVTRFRIKNTSGGLVNEYTLSSNIPASHEILAVEYVGPKNLSGPINDVTFFTLEKASSTQCIIKRWELNTSFSLLALKQEIIKNTSGNNYYDATAMAVEHYNREFKFSINAGVNYFEMDSTSRITAGIKLFLGPSTDTDNPGAYEIVTVSNVIGNFVYLNSNTNYQYVLGDPITFYNNIYIVSDLGYGGDDSQGTIFKIDAYSGNQLEYVNAGVYQDVNGAKWSTITNSIALINDTQLLFIRPYTYYQNWRSMFLNNVVAVNDDIFDIVDVVFDEYNLYKLALKTVQRDDDGNKHEYTWSTYNYQQDTLVPYSSHITIFTDKANLAGYNQYTAIHVQVRDQFNVSLRDININMYNPGGDPGYEFTPLNGQAITDSDGRATIGYTSGTNFVGFSEIRVRADHCSVFTGSEYVWNEIRIRSDLDYSSDLGTGYTPSPFNLGYHGRGSGLTQRDYFFSQVFMFGIHDPYKTLSFGYRDREGTEQEVRVPENYILCYSFFTSPGGNWSSYGLGYEFDKDYWYWFEIGGRNRTDGPWGGPHFPCEPWVGISCGLGYNPLPNRITLLSEFTQVDADEISPPDHKAGRVKQLTDFWIYQGEDVDAGASLEDGVPPYLKAFTIDCEHDLQLSQLKQSRHTYYLEGDAVDELIGNVYIDQFIFIALADPAFFSEKNPKETDIWVRMIPYFFSLDPTTLKFYVREIWTEDEVRYDTGYREVVSLYGPFTDLIYPPSGPRYCSDGGVVCIDLFDAGGGSEGIEFLYNPPENFHHNAIVYVHIEIYDEAPDPNIIYTDYWFKIIPDFNSPYLENMNPDREQDQVPVDTEIYFEIKDDGAGVDIDSLEVFLNSRILVPTTITKVSNYHYKVNCVIPYELQFGRVYDVGVKVPDLSENRNYLRDSYRFYTADSSEPIFEGFDPYVCRRGMPRFTDVEFVVLGDGQGVDRDTIRLQVHNADVTDKSNITPIIYRVS